MVTLTYIYHDGFVLETPQATLVFDYWRDGTPDFSSDERVGEDNLDPGFISRVRRDVPVYFIVSHHHKDHFSRLIFQWRDVADEVRFIISRDVEKSIRYMLRPDSMYRGIRPFPRQVTVLRPGESYRDDRIAIDAFGSTDTGNSYMVEVGGRKVFHAGDLNAWIWKDESTAAEVAAAIREYAAVLDTILSKSGERIDLAMFPVDSRIGTDYWEGAAMFVRKFDVGVFVPMHFGLGENPEDARKKADDACRFSAYANPSRGIYVALRDPYASLAMPSVSVSE